MYNSIQPSTFDFWIILLENVELNAPAWNCKLVCGVFNPGGLVLWGL